MPTLLARSIPGTLSLLGLLLLLLDVRESYEVQSNQMLSTRAALEKKNDLWCFECDTISEGDRCINVTRNDTTLHSKCKDDKRTCMVKRFSYTTSTENSTSTPKMWGLQRNCTNKCEAGCIVIGERTKLYSCTTCCDEKFCNTGTAGATTALLVHCQTASQLLLAFVLQILLTIIALEPS